MNRLLKVLTIAALFGFSMADAITLGLRYRDNNFKLQYLDIDVAPDASSNEIRVAAASALGVDEHDVERLVAKGEVMPFNYINLDIGDLARERPLVVLRR